MKRPVWKLPYIHPVLFKKYTLRKKSLQFKIRNTIIPANYINKQVYIYNGAWFSSKEIKKSMLGLKLGEFSFSKIIDKRIHTKKSRKSKKKSSKHKV